MNFGFSNLLGSPYRGGPACFHKDYLYVSVGNRVAKVSLDTTTTHILKCEAQCDIDIIALRPDGLVLAVVDNGVEKQEVEETRTRTTRKAKRTTTTARETIIGIVVEQHRLP